MPKKMYILQIFTCILSLALVMVVETFTDLDIWIQKFWFDDVTKEWLLNSAGHQKYRWLFYGGAKKAIAIFSAIVVFVFIAGLLKKKWRHLIAPTLLIILSVSFIPMTASTGKRYTNIYCPKEITEFGGPFAYQKVLECPRPENTGKKNGACFPAAHASGGFALMALFFCMRRRWLGLGIGFCSGWIMGNYQMIRGDHFFLHTAATMVLAWLIILLALPLANRFSAWYLRKRNWPA